MAPRAEHVAVADRHAGRRADQLGAFLDHAVLPKSDRPETRIDLAARMDYSARPNLDLAPEIRVGHHRSTRMNREAASVAARTARRPSPREQSRWRHRPMLSCSMHGPRCGRDTGRRRWGAALGRCLVQHGLPTLQQYPPVPTVSGGAGVPAVVPERLRNVPGERMRRRSVRGAGQAVRRRDRREPRCGLLLCPPVCIVPPPAPDTACEAIGG